MLKVSYSQALGVIGYCLLPLTLIALILPLVSAFHYIQLLFKVRQATLIRCIYY